MELWLSLKKGAFDRGEKLFGQAYSSMLARAKAEAKRNKPINWSRIVASSVPAFQRAGKATYLATKRLSPVKRKALAPLGPAYKDPFKFTVYAENLDARVKAMADTIQGDILRLVRDSIESGDVETAGTALEDLDLSNTDWDEVFNVIEDARLETASVTEASTAVNGSLLEDYSQLGLDQYYEWVNAADERVRENHIRYGNSGAHPLGFNYAEIVGEDYTLEYPTDPRADLSDTINCFLPGTMVGGRIVAASKARYSGMAWRIETDRGHFLSVTPNHPILTNRGWIPAQEISEGDYLLSDKADVRAGMLRNVDNEYPEASVDEVFESLSANGTLRTSVVTGLDFHGDSRWFQDANIDVVSINREVLDRIQSIRSQQVDNISLKLDVPVVGLAGSGDGSVFEFRRAGLSSGHGSMGSGDLSGSSLRSHARPFDLLLCGSASRFDAVLPENPVNSESIDSEVFRESEHRLTGLVARDKVASVSVYPFSGFVYDIQTVGGWVHSNGIIAHNCRCVLAPATLSSQEKSFFVKSPPWHIEHDGSRWKVVVSETGRVVGTHDTDESAKAQLRALYANVDIRGEKGGAGSGDLPGHAFHGNQWTNGMQALADIGLKVEGVDLSKLTSSGLFEGSSTRISTDKEPYRFGKLDRVKIINESKDGVSIRYIVKDEDGKLFLHNWYFKSNLPRGSAMGAKMLLSQILEARKSNIPLIRTEATLDRGMNGYYTWARLGYRNENKITFFFEGPRGNDKPFGEAKAFAEMDPELLQHFEHTVNVRTAHGNTTTTHSYVLPPGKIVDLMKTEAGRAWWKEWGQTFDAVIDTSSEETVGLLRRYLADHAKSEKSAKVREAWLKGGSGSGDREGHTFRGNQWTNRGKTEDAPKAESPKAEEVKPIEESGPLVGPGHESYWAPEGGFKATTQSAVAKAIAGETLERGAAWDAQGRFLGSYTSNLPSRIYTPGEVARAAANGGTMMHCHPPPADKDDLGGAGFSPGDINNAVFFAIGQSVVATKLGGSVAIYTISGMDKLQYADPSERSKLADRMGKRLEQIYKDEYDDDEKRPWAEREGIEHAFISRVFGEGRTKITRGGKFVPDGPRPTPAFQHALQVHSALKQLASEFGLSYSVSWKGVIKWPTWVQATAPPWGGSYTEPVKGTLDDALNMYEEWRNAKRNARSAA